MSSSKLKNIREFINSPKHQERIPHIKRAILLSEKIYGRRKDLWITQSELAERAETTQRVISQIEEGIYAPERWIGDQLYDKLAIALEIDRDYIISDKIDRKTFELFAYLCSKIWWKLDIMQFMKLPYFIDLKSVKNLGFQITNFEYIISDLPVNDGKKLKILSYKTPPMQAFWATLWGTEHIWERLNLAV